MDKGDDVGGSGISRDAGGGGGEKIVLNGRILSDHRPSDPYNTGTEHVGFSSTRQTFFAWSAKEQRGGGS